jgi:hypothetical protein
MNGTVAVNINHTRLWEPIHARPMSLPKAAAVPPPFSVIGVPLHHGTEGGPPTESSTFVVGHLPHLSLTGAVRLRTSCRAYPSRTAGRGEIAGLGSLPISPLAGWGRGQRRNQFSFGSQPK